jgi:hypothetical protein
MIGFVDTLTLAVTKLRIRKVRLGVTVLTAGLLFSVLVFGSLLSRGVTSSLGLFMSEGLLNRYAVSIIAYPEPLQSNPALIAEVKTLEKSQIASKIAEAGRLKLAYDPNLQVSAITALSAPDGKKTEVVDLSNPVALQALAIINRPDDFTKNLIKDVASYHVKSVSSAEQLGGGVDGYTLLPVVSGKEISSSSAAAQGDSLSRFGLTLQSLDSSLIEPFKLPGTTLSTNPGEPVPIILPLDSVETLLAKTPLPRKATPQQKLNYIKDVRSAARGLTFDVCYRNAAAAKLSDTAAAEVKARLAAAATPGYTPPTVEYAAPTKPCQPTVITKDTRTAAEKTAAENQALFDQKFGIEAPITSPISFRIAGILPPTFSATQANDPLGLAAIFLTSSLGEGFYIPKAAVATQPVLARLFATTRLVNPSGTLNYVEFRSRATQKAFVDDHTCSPDSSGNGDVGVDPFQQCRVHHQYLSNLFGNPLAALQDISNQASRALSIIVAVLATLAGLVMMGTIGKIIADSRKETSVFRALGARRRDIAQIYLLFSIMLATFGLIVATVIGSIAAVILDIQNSPALTAQALLAFNSSQLTHTFHIVAVNPVDFIELIGFAIAVGVTGALLPLATNLRRSPIKDMREE